jgi:rare lipoprotein A
MACSLGARAVAPDPAATAPPGDSQPGEHQAGPVHEAVVAQKFSGRKMADGTIMQPQGDNAASKTLPLGTTARVTNLENGRSAVVTIRDRGPYIQGRIVDLSPSTAKEIGIEHKNGVAKVEVAPILVPLPDGHVKLGAAVTDNSEQIGRFALSSDNFAHLTDAEFPDPVKLHMGH